MLSTLIAVVGSLLGVHLGILVQHLQADQAHRRHLDDLLIRLFKSDLGIRQKTVIAAALSGSSQP